MTAFDSVMVNRSDISPAQPVKTQVSCCLMSSVEGSQYLINHPESKQPGS